MTTAGTTAILACCIFAGAPLGTRAQSSPAARYTQAVRTMAALPQPPYISFSANFVGVGTGFGITRRDDGDVNFVVSTSGSSPGPIATSYRAADRRATLTLADGPASTRSALLDPTWAGAADFARYGLHPLQASPATPSPAPTPADGPATIGGVTVFSVAFYRVTDGGGAVCPSGTNGAALHLVAFNDPRTHPLTDAIVEAGTGRICSMTFRLHVNGPIAYAPSVELHFADVGGYYLATDGFIDGEIHALGFGIKHTHIDILRTGWEFPAVVPATLAR